MRAAVAEPGAGQLGGTQRAVVGRAERQPVGRAGVAGRKPQPVARAELIEVARPAVERPGKIVCVGLNYRSHVTEGAGRDVPDRPLLFSKFANAVVGDGDPIVRPEGCHALDLEVELGVVIGTRASHVPRATALDHVTGYVVVNDVTARDWQGTRQALAEGERGDGQWLRAKGSDTFLPVGPVLVTADEIPDPSGLALRSWRIPGAGPDAGQAIPMQDGTTADMVFDVPSLIEYISAHITLDPGDLLITGTPSGVGVFREPPVFLEPGDVVRCEVERIGRVENRVMDGATTAY
jgi:2-keto-4-pentenoate hydratase/2-oxohepta-3-ene-1,7-dioic acid hydratase in catechol pathway